MEVQRVIEPELQENTYVVIDGNDCVLIDPGSNRDDILAYIYEKISGKRLRGILYTHCHYDHIRGGRYFNVPQYMSKEDIESLPLFSERARAFYGVEFNEPINLKKLPEELNLGTLHFKILKTPGHTPGGVCISLKGKFNIIIEGKRSNNLTNEEILFTGDTLFKGTYGRTDLGGNSTLMRTSLISLSKLPFETIIYPGHGPSSTIGDEVDWIKTL